MSLFNLFKELPKPTGPYNIGTTINFLVNNEQQEPHSKNPNEKRKLMVQFWYPTTKTQKAKTKKISYIENKIAPVSKMLTQKTHIPNFFWKHFLKIQSNANLNSPILNTQKDYPVIIFCHGLKGDRETYAAFAEELASNGYIIISIDFPYACSLTVFPDGEVITINKTLDDIELASKKWTQYIIKENKIWQNDIKFILDQLKIINNNKNEIFYNKLNLNKIGILGHSMGGTVSIESCRNNDQIKAGISLDGWHYDINSSQSFEKPFLIMLGEESTMYGKPKMPMQKILQHMKMNLDQYNQWIQRSLSSINLFCQNMKNNCSKIIVEGASHTAFANVILAKKLLCIMMNLENGTASKKPYQTIKFINQNILNFFNKNLKN